MWKNKLNTLTDDEYCSLLTKLQNIWETCTCCPSQCRTDRTKNPPPCGAVRDGIKAASFAVHDGEEPPVSGYNGAGNIFFSGCTLKCIFCQNWPISHENNGKIYSSEEFAKETLKLLSKGVHNINLVTADQYLYPVLKSLFSVREQITKPLVYNCSGYFTAEMLNAAIAVSDIFLYDVKYIDPSVAAAYSRFAHYVDADWMGMDMLAEKPIPWLEDDLGILQSGLIIRHLVIPGAIQNSLDVLDKLADYRDRGLDFKISLMSQYFPAYNAVDHTEINRRLNQDEYDQVVQKMELLDLDGWIQSLE